MRSYFSLAVVIIVAFLLSLSTVKLFSFEEISLFLTVIGLIYGLIAAFAINNAWERFSKIRDAIAEETSSLAYIHLMARHLSDRAAFKRIATTMESYCRAVPDIEWHEYWKGARVHEKFHALQEQIATVRIKNKYDMLLVDKIMDELRDATGARDQQLVLSQNRISSIQWALNLFLSAILVIGLVFLQIPNTTLSVFIVTAMIAAVLMILVVIYELDSMKIAEEEVSIEPYLAIVRTINPKARITARDILKK